MLSRVQWTLLVAGTGLLALLLLAVLRLQRDNEALQAELVQQQQYVQQTGPLEQVQREMARMLAMMAARGQDGDGRIRALLTAPAASAVPAR